MEIASNILGVTSGFLALLVSAMTFSIFKGIEIWKEVTWNERIKVLKLAPIERHLLVNDGDGEVYLNDVSYFDENRKSNPYCLY